ncbi:MAG: LuxR family transcriptional regulator [Pseudomonadota bacterium]
MDSLKESLWKTNSLEEVQTLIVDLRDELGVAHVVYHVVGGTGREYGAFTYDPDWVEQYKTEEMLRYDPVVLEAGRRFHPLDWKRLDWTNKKARRVLTEAIDSGVGKQGLSFPIRGVGGQFAMFSVTSYDTDQNWDKFIGERGQELLIGAHYVHDRVSTLMEGEIGIETKALSPRERDALALLAAGRSRAEAAEKLNISEHTFRVYIDTARHKLGAVNTVHAVAKAVSSGLILP